MPRENSKCRKWEKERRNRLKEGFSGLAKLLPCYDPSLNISKIDILQKAASSLQELQDKIQKLLASDSEKNNESADTIKKLHARIKKLLVRNEQLSNLLRDAGITIPSVCGTIKKFKSKHPLSKRISPEQAEILEKNEMEKENICSKVRAKKKKTKSANIGFSSKRRTDNMNVSNQTGKLSRIKRNRKAPNSTCFIVVPQPPTAQKYVNQHCYLISTQSPNTPNVITGNSVSSSGVFLKPMVIKSKSRRTKGILRSTSHSTPCLGPGTLILANGTVMRILPQCQTIQPTLSALPNKSTIMVPKNIQLQNGESNKKTISISRSQPNSQTSIINTFSTIRPKYCLTTTTQVNKVPIPALTSRYANNFLLLKEPNVQSKETKLKIVEKSKTVPTENSKKINKDGPNKRKIEDGGKSESTPKKTKQCCKNDSSDDKTCKNVSHNHPVSVSVDTTHDTIMKPNHQIEPKKVVKEKIQNEVFNLTKEVVTEKRKDADIEINVTQKDNVADNTIKSDSFQKSQEVPDSSSINIQVTSVISSTVTTNTTKVSTANDVIRNLDLNLSHSELSNDLFASLQVPSGCQNPESTSPTAAFLLAFPLVSSGVKVTEVIEEENSDSQRGTPTLLQIGTMDATKSIQSQTDTVTSNFLNLDSFCFFTPKESCGNFYNNYLNSTNKSSKTSVATSLVTTMMKSDTAVSKSIYVNVKSPCLPSCVTESIKENCIYDLKTSNSTKVINNIDTCEKKGSSGKVNSSDFGSSSQPISKSNSNYTLSKENEQKARYCISSTYSNSTCNFTYRTDTETKLCTSSYVNISRNYGNPLYTNCSNYNYSYHPDTNFNQNYYKNISRNEGKPYYPPLNYESYPDYRKNDVNALSGYYDTSHVKENRNIVKAKPENQNKLPVNWMTTPDSRLQNSSECLLNSFSKGDFSQTYPFTSYTTSCSTYFTNTTTDTIDTSCIIETKKCLEIPPAVSINSHQRMDVEEKQFSWSPTKLPHFLDHPHNFVTSTLPTLVGDLALGNTLPFAEQKNDYKHPKENKEFKRSIRNNSYENRSNFFSVSQLVDHNKPENGPAKTSVRRNSGNRSKSGAPQKVKKNNKPETKEMLTNCGISNDKICERLMGNCNMLSNNETFSEQKNRNLTKNTSSIYSAEALIGNQVPEDSFHRRYPSSTKSITTGFLTENIISYFPPVDLPQETYMTQNQNYQATNLSHSICSSQNNTYSSNSFIYAPSTITSTYLPPNNFEQGPHDYLPDNLMSNASTKEKQYNIKHFNKQHLNKDEKNNVSMVCPNNLRKAKKKPSETGTSLTNFEFPFLPLHGSNNSPILPDDFHSHTNFLPPTTPFSCKNTLYTKQSDLPTNSILPLPSIARTNLQHPEISPSINSVGTSLTNFNLSTIFPEINKQGPITEVYPETRIRDHSHTKTSVALQVPFSTEPKFSYNT